MESLLGKSLISESIAFLPLGTAAEKSDAHVRIGRAKAVKEPNLSSPCSSSGSNSSMLPIPSSRSLFPGPLKFLWFSSSNEVSEEIEGAEKPPDHLEQVENECNRSEPVETEETEDPRKSWTDSIWRVRTMLPRRNPALEEDISNSGDQNRRDGEEVSLEDAVMCRACEMDGTEECFVDSCEGSMLEVPHVQVSHNMESFSEFLQPIPLTVSREVSRMAHLCNLAYKIRDIEPSELFSLHQLRFITSSLETKDEALANSSTTAPPATEETDAGKQRFPLTPSSAYGLASAVASYLHSRAKMLLRLKKRNEALQKDGPTSSEDSEMPVGDAGTDYESSEMASFIASSPVTAVVAAKEGTKDAVAKDLQSLHNCPCDWYCCDDRRNSTRYFVIQGSESLASWQANLLFEPTHFEDSSLGVLVHRGVYEAAKGLYEQLLPCVLEHVKEHGEQAQLCFTGHSLGGSLGTLVSLMLQIRGVVQAGALLPVMTFGSPCIMCGGDYLLEKLGLPEDHVRSVMLHRDIVPRTFACNYPDHVAEILKRLNGSFRDHPCLNNQRLLYAPMGQFIILQPAEDDAPPHPLLPTGLGLYLMRHPQKSTLAGQLWSGSTLTGQAWPKSTSVSQQKVEVRAAQRAFLNSPHPLEILSDPGAYGNEGSISRDHDPRSYLKSVLKVVREETKKQRRLKRQQRRGSWWPLMRGEFTSMFESTEVLQKRRVNTDYGKLAGINHSQIVLVFFLSAKVILMQGFAAFFAWT